MITAAEDPTCLKDFDYLISCQNPLYAGIDVGRKRDLFVIDIGEKVGSLMYDRFRIELSNRPYHEMAEQLHRVLDLPQLRRACIDQGLIGNQLAEDAQFAFPSKLLPVSMNAQEKERLAYGLHAAFSDNALRIPWTKSFGPISAASKEKLRPPNMSASSAKPAIVIAIGSGPKPSARKPPATSLRWAPKSTGEPPFKLL